MITQKKIQRTGRYTYLAVGRSAAMRKALRKISKNSTQKHAVELAIFALAASV